jgi:hypothetical protein
MRKKITCLLFIFTLFVLASTSFAGIWGESVSISDLSDGRSLYNSNYDLPNSEGGLQGYWPSVFTIQWDITQDLDTSLWTYEYTIFSDRKDVSHFILEITKGEEFGDIVDPRVQYENGNWESEIPEGGRIWDGTNGNSDPGWPEGASMFGIKFDTGSNYISYAFETTRDPVWGNFYVKSGKHEGENVYAYNSGLDPANADSSNTLDFIARPDGGSNPPVVPEPASSLLFLSGSAVFAYRRYFKRG